MTKTYKMATKKQQVAKDIVRAAKTLDLKLWFRCNKQNHSVEFMLLADPLEIKHFSRWLEEAAQQRAEMAMHIYG